MKRLLYIVAFLLIAINSFAANRYAVPSGGATSGSCTIGSPCTLAYAISGMSGGDDIYMRGGTYDCSVSTGSGAIIIPLDKDGTSGDHSSLQSYPGEWAVLDGKFNTGASYGFVIGNSSDSVIEYWDFKRFEIKGGRYTLTSNSSTGISFTGTGRNCTLSHLYVHDNYVPLGHSNPGANNPSGIRLGASNHGWQNTIVEYNYTINNGQIDGSNGNCGNITFYGDYQSDPATIDDRISTAYYGNTIRYNLIVNSPVGFKQKGRQWLAAMRNPDITPDYTHAEKANKLHHNIFLNQTEIPLNTYTDFTQIYNNIIDESGGNSKRTMIGDGTYERREPFFVNVYNNTFINSHIEIAHGTGSNNKNSSGGQNYLLDASDPSGFVARSWFHLNNNIFYGIGDPPDQREDVNILWTYSSWDYDSGDINMDYYDVSYNFFSRSPDYVSGTSYGTIEVGDGSSTGANTYSVNSFDSAFSSTNYAVPDTSSLFSSGYKTNGSFSVGGATIANGGIGGNHPYLSGVTIPSYIGATNPSDDDWVDVILSLSTYQNLRDGIEVGDPVEPPPEDYTITVAATDDSANEETSDTGTWTITSNSAVDGDLVINISLSGSATNGTDYSTIGSSATISDGDTTTTVTLTPINDDDYENGSETATLTIASGSGYDVGTPSSANITILDTDPYQEFGAGKIYGENSAADYTGTVEDSWMNKYSQTEMHTTNVELWTYTYGQEGDTNWSANNIILKVDLSTYDSETINTAKLWLHNKACLDCGDSTHTISVHEITGVTPVMDQLNWTYYATGSEWTGATNDVQGGYSDIGAALDTVSVGTSPQWYSWDIKSALTPGQVTWLLVISDYGITPATNDTNRNFDSSEAVDTNLRPVIIVDYDTQVEPPDPIDFINGTIYGSNTDADVAGGLLDTYNNSGAPSTVENTNDPNNLNTYIYPVDTVANRVFFQPLATLYNPGIPVNKARLYMYFYGCDGDACGDSPVTLTIHKVTSASKPDFDYLTWTNYKSATAWSSAGGDIGDAFDSTTLTDTVGQWIELDVSDEWQDCLDGTDSICTWAVAIQTPATSLTNRYFRSSEYTDSDYRPMMIVEWKVPTIVKRLTISNGYLKP
jgi:hypothetical protein